MYVQIKNVNKSGGCLWLPKALHTATPLLTRIIVLGYYLVRARIPRKVEVPSTLTLRVEVKEPTEDEKHSGSDHPWRFNHISILLHSELGEEVNCSSRGAPSNTMCATWRSHPINQSIKSYRSRCNLGLEISSFHG